LKVVGDLVAAKLHATYNLQLTTNCQ